MLILYMLHERGFSEFLSCFYGRSSGKIRHLRRLYAEILMSNGELACRRAGQYLYFYEAGKRLEPGYYSEGVSGILSGRKEKVPASSVKDLVKLRSIIASHKSVPASGFDSFGISLSDEPARRSLGLYFTGNALSVFTANYIRVLLGPEAYEKLFFFDPAAGSGNLLAALLAPGRILGSDINPENILAQRKRNIRCTAGPIDFLKAGDTEINSLLPASPVFFLMNPPYRGKSTGKTGRSGIKRGISASYSAGKELRFLLEKEGLRSTDLSSFFIVKALSLLEQKGGGYLGVFTPTNWLTGGRREHEGLLRYVSGKAGFLGGFLVNGKDHFPGVRSGMPVAFSVFKFGVKGEDPVFSDLTGGKKGIAEARDPAGVLALITAVPEAKLASGKRVFFRDIFRAKNAQTGDDSKLLYDIQIKNGRGSPPESLRDIPDCRIFLAATDRKAGYAAAVKPLKKKRSGCQFTISRELPGPALAWHYLWDYLKVYPPRLYNAVPAVRKYAYTYIEPRPILSVKQAAVSGAVRRDACAAKHSGEYIREWLGQVGDLRGLWFFYFALAGSKAAARIGSKAVYRNLPVWCPPLSEKNAPLIGFVSECGYEMAFSKYSKKFGGFRLLRGGAELARAVNYFEKDRIKPLSGKHLSKGSCGGILKKRGGLETLKERAEEALSVLYPESIA